MTRHRIALVALALVALAARGGAQDVTRLTGSGPNDLWAVTEGSSMLHFNGRQWATVPTGMQVVIADVYSAGPRDAWAVGEQGTILRWNGSAWRPMASPVRKDLVRVNGCGGSVVYVLAQSQHNADPLILLRWDGSAWTQTPITPPFRGHDIYLVCGAGAAAGAGEVVVAGTAYFDPTPREVRYAGAIARMRGGAWTITGFDGRRGTVPALADLGIEHYCAGAGGTHAAVRRSDGGPAVLRQAGASWSVMPPPNLPAGSDMVDATWALARDCTPLVVFNQGIARYRAGQWQVVAPGVAANAALTAQGQQLQQMTQGLNMDSLRAGQVTPQQMQQLLAIAQAQQAQQGQIQQGMDRAVAAQVWQFGQRPAVWAPSGADFYVSTRAGRIVHVVGDSATTVYDTICQQPVAAQLPQCQANPVRRGGAAPAGLPRARP